MTPTDRLGAALARIGEMADAAPKGPWQIGGGQMRACNERWTLRGPGGEYLAHIDRRPGGVALGAFVASARSDVPTLLSVVRELVAHIRDTACDCTGGDHPFDPDCARTLAEAALSRAAERLEGKP